jgi:phosphatidylglycerol---prolipoprotein diacylglyceryl transferase
LNLILFLILWNIAKNQKPSGFLTGVYLIGYGVIRIFLENFRDGNMIWKLGSIPTAIAFGLIAVGVGLRLISQKRS